MTLLIQTLWTILAALTVENLLLPGTLGLSRMLRSARKPEHRLWYAGFVAIFSAVSLEVSLLLPPQLFSPYGNVLRPFCLALCTGAAYCAASFLLSRFAPGFFRRHGSALAPAAINTIVLAMPFARQTLALGAVEGLGYAFGTGLLFYLVSLILAPAYDRCAEPHVPACFRGLPAALLTIAVLSLAFLGFTGGKIF